MNGVVDIMITFLLASSAKRKSRACNWVHAKIKKHPLILFERVSLETYKKMKGSCSSGEKVRDMEALPNSEARKKKERKKERYISVF